MKLSAVLISFNEEDNLRRTLEPLRGLADEIILLDSFSTDQTVSIARELGAQIFQEPWPGHVAQKNSALQKCSGDWILSLDCDEVLTPELAEQIRKVIANPASVQGYRLRRRTFYLGRFLRYAWQPDLRLRLVRREAQPRWTGLDPHDKLTIQGQVKTLPGFLDHYSFRDFAAHMETTRKHAQTSAQSYFARGKTATAPDIILRPLLRLVKRLLLQRAFLDGLPGWSAALSSAFSVYMKYVFLWELQKQPKKLK